RRAVRGRAPARAAEAEGSWARVRGGGAPWGRGAGGRGRGGAPNRGRGGPPLILLTLGSIARGAALHPKAVRLRAIPARLAAEPSILWVDCQSRADIMNFWDFDPVEGIGAHVGGTRCNPWIWMLRFRDMLSPQFF